MLIIAKGEPCEATLLDTLTAWAEPGAVIELCLGIAILMIAAAILIQARSEERRR